MPQRFVVASPIALLPVGVPVVAVHGAADATVPVEQSEAYVAMARAAGDPAELVTLAGVGHMDLIDSEHSSWHSVLDRLARW